MVSSGGDVLFGFVAESYLYSTGYFNDVSGF